MKKKWLRFPLRLLKRKKINLRVTMKRKKPEVKT
jgi:hypothetical protein